VSNLAFIAKVVQKLVCHQLVALSVFNFCQVYSLPIEKKHSTETAVLKVIANVLRAADQGEVSLGACQTSPLHLTQ